ncbi:unnamed protein product [Phytophthora lilii]|uniref:Unnamed protein product n=1 Tax=Phytophthora lilii TaxID=2077276 RepID=A0A9W6TER2_9STRA|nr:unnamed protein product [Phytophthora lilii]
MPQFSTGAAMRTSVVAPREAFSSPLKPKKRLSSTNSRPSPPLLIPLLLCAPLALTFWRIWAELALVTFDNSTVNQVQRILHAAEEASPVLHSTNETLLANATFYPEEIFEVDWRLHIKVSDILHENALHRGCVKHKSSIIPWTFGRVRQNENAELDELVNRSDPNLLDKLRKCPDVDILLPDHLRSYGYCEDAAAYTKCK